MGDFDYKRFKEYRYVWNDLKGSSFYTSPAKYLYFTFYEHFHSLINVLCIKEGSPLVRNNFHNAHFHCYILFNYLKFLNVIFTVIHYFLTYSAFFV